ncbi:MAG TPA: hypothetical protein IAC49_06730 [Candidatus Ventricola intestinavium]|nr:hypothetical protein [Candidatus Ventricola intestinavium]
MGTLADSLFTVLMGWVRALVNSIWALFSADHTTLLEFFGKNWMLIALVIIAAGLVVDWLVWLVRWQPYHLWALRVRRLLRLPSPEEEEEERAHAARMPQRAQAAAFPEEKENWLPLERPVIDEQQAQEVFRRADSVPDEQLGAYPGMRYGSQAAPRPDTEETQRYAAIHSEGPGTAEVNRRRAEIDAWQKQIQEEARARAQAELAAREAEKARLAQEAYEAEQARLAQEAYEAEQARLAQEEYERQMAEYERQKAQYERDLAEYERQKAAYEAEIARQNAGIVAEEGPSEDQENGVARRRRAAMEPATYSDYVGGETVQALPDPPQWPQISAIQTEEHRVPRENAKKKPRKGGGLVSKVAKMIEPEDEEISAIASLPPRVDMHEAYRPAKKPQKRGLRKR